MANPDDGGPAYPAVFPPEMFDPRGDNRHVFGMSVRDFFAAAALQGIMSSHHPGSGQVDWQNHAARDAYSMADAMLRQRHKDTD